MNFVTPIALVLAAYALGCFITGYYLVRLRTGKDVRTSSSGSAGAADAARALGAWAFLLTFLINMIKGAMAVWAARIFHLPPAWLVACMIAVVAGHIWPAQLDFRGGKGVATLLGALVAFDLNIIVLFLLTVSILHLTSKNFMQSGLSGVALISVFAAILGHTRGEIIGLTILVIIVLQSHRDDIKDILAEYGYGKRQAGK